MYCSSSLMAAYPKMGPSLPDPVYPTPSTYTAQPYMSFATEASAFYTPMVSSWTNSDNLDSWRSLPHHTTWPYESSMSAYPYTPSYGGLDVRRKNATRESTSTLKAWLYEHIKNPYPTKGEKIMLAIITKMTLTQVSTWFANARRRLKKENKMQWSPRNRTGDEEDDKSLDSETENPQSDNNNNSNNSNNNNNNNNKELRKDKRDESVDKNHIDEDETIVVDNIIGEDILMSISDRRKANNSTMTRGSGNDVTSYLACSSLSSNKHSSVAPDNHRTPSSRFQPFADPHQARVQPSATQHQKKFSQPLSMPACGNIGLSLASSLSSSSSSASSASSSLSSSFHSPSPLPPYNIFSQPPGGSNFYPHPSFMHGFTPSYCASGSGVFSSGREYNSNSGRSLFSHSYKPLTPCGTTDSSSDSSQPFLNLSVTQLPGMMPSSIEGVSKPRIWSLADVATSVVDESPAAVAAVVAPTYSASDSMFGQQQQHFAPPNSYFSISSRTTSDDPDKKTAAASLPFKGHDDGKNESLEDEYENIVMNSVDRRQNQEKSLKNQLLSPTSEDRYQQFSSCGGPYSNSYNFPFPERTFQRRQDYNVVNCSSSSSSSSFSLFPGSFFGNANSDMLQTVQGSSPTYFHATAYNDNTTLERQYREEKNKSKISIT